MTKNESGREPQQVRRRSVLHITEAWGGGVQTAIESYVANATDLDHSVIARARPGAFGYSTIAPSRLELADVSVARFLIRCARVLRTTDASVVHLHSSYAGLLRAVPTRARLVYTPHCYATERADLPRWARKTFEIVERTLTPRATVAGVSARECDLAKDVMGARRVVFLPNTASTITPTPEDGNEVVTLGRISRQKDPALFAAIATRMRTSGLQFTWIGGGDPELAKILIDSGVNVTGWLAHGEALHALAKARCYVHTAEWEGTPLALLEAAQLDKAIVARSIPAFIGLPIRLLPPSAALFAHEILQLCSNPDALEAAIARSRQLTEAHSSDAQHAALAAIYG